MFKSVSCLLSQSNVNKISERLRLILENHYECKSNKPSDRVPIGILKSILLICFVTVKSKITKILNSEENSKRKFLIKWQNQKLKHIKQMDNNCHIPDLIQAFS